MQKSATLKDIARETGVHVSTVSRALDPNARVSLSSEVVERIRNTAKRLGYRPNRQASSLRTNRTMSVGIILPDITNTIFPPIVRGVESVLEPLGYATIIVNTDGEREREKRLIGFLSERGVDGVIDAAAGWSSPELITLSERGTPVVTANRQVKKSQLPSAVNDDADGIRQIVNHLYEAGHRKIAHIAGPQELSTGLLRLTAFRTAASDLGLDIPQEAIAIAARFDEDEGFRCAKHLLALDWPLTAIVCANDRLALGVLQALSDENRACPDEISVTGFNDMPFLDMIPPGLTTIRIQQFDVGRQSAELLLKMMTEPEATVPVTIVLPVTLIKRGSVARLK